MNDGGVWIDFDADIEFCRGYAIIQFSGRIKVPAYSSIEYFVH